jgi:hypothetical protein
MPGFMPGIHVFEFSAKKDVDGRDKPGHDGTRCFRQKRTRSRSLGPEQTTLLTALSA